MNVAFLYDPGNADGTLGGAELTMREFANAAPAHVTLTDDLADADTVVVGNCVTFPPNLILSLAGKRVVRYHHDLARHEHPDLREWLERCAEHVFTSPLHRRLYGLEGECIPPAVDLAAFRPSRQQRRHGKRGGACAIAPWQNPGKGQHMLREWSDKHGPVDVYGTGHLVPQGPDLNYCGPLEPSDVAGTLQRYERFVHLPTAPEPFGRAVVEAWAAGCGLVVNRLVGALHYIREDPERLTSDGEDFWRLVVERTRAATRRRGPLPVGTHR
jgi:hypothetical protein